jgi:putative nucleotidyltransferase-like protein
MTSPSSPQRAAWAGLTAACQPVPGSQLTDLLAALITDDADGGLGDLIALAVDRKVLPLVAAAIEPLAADLGIRPRMRRFLHQQLAMSRYITLAFRHEAARINTAADRQGLLFAMVKGVSAEQVLYGGQGTRALNDIDVLVDCEDMPAFVQILTELGYDTRDEPRDRRPHAPVAGAATFPGHTSVTCVRRDDDLIVPRFVVDLITRFPGADGASKPVSAVLSRRVPASRLNPTQPDVDLPVLSGHDQLTFTLAAISADMRRRPDAGPALNLCADALRLHHRGHSVDRSLDPSLLAAVTRAARWISRTFPATGFPAHAGGDRPCVEGQVPQ